MAVLATQSLTLADYAKRIGPDNKVSMIIEMLSQANPILEDVPFMEANGATYHRTSIRTGLPTSYWKKYNEGVPTSKSTTAQVDESMGLLEAWSEVDFDLANLSGNPERFRLTESAAFLESMSQEAASTLIYGSSTAPEEFVGLAERYNSLSAANAQNIVNGNGSDTDMSSVWLICWGDQSVHGIYPRGSQAGLSHRNHGDKVIETAGSAAAGKRLNVYQDQFKWHLGLVLKDWRYAVRIANIDISALVAKSSAADLIELMIKATHRIQNLSYGKCAFYMNRTCYQMLDIQRYDNAAGAGMTYAEVDGKIIPTFRTIPIKVCDALTETETEIS